MTVTVCDTLLPEAVAVITALPPPTAVTTPVVELTVATAGLSLAKVTPEGATGLPFASAALNVTV
jgi:hypothetical protein